jgi:hypothetical protein
MWTMPPKVLGVHHEDASRPDHQVIEVAPRAGHPPVVEDPDPGQLRQRGAERLLAPRPAGPGAGGLGVVGEGEHDTAHPLAPAILHAGLAIRVPALVLALCRGPGHAGVGSR